MLVTQYKCVKLFLINYNNKSLQLNLSSGERKRKNQKCWQAWNAKFNIYQNQIIYINYNTSLELFIMHVPDDNQLVGPV